MRWIEGDLLEVGRTEGCDVIAFTANSVVMRKGFRPALVMGAGAAKRVKESFPNIDLDLGMKIAMRSTHSTTIEQTYDRFIHGVQPDYHICGVRPHQLHVVAVQVKRDWRDPGDWELTEESLKRFAGALRRNGGKAVLNCPLIGLGGFADREEEVKEMVERRLGKSDVVVVTI